MSLETTLIRGCTSESNRSNSRYRHFRYLILVIFANFEISSAQRGRFCHNVSFRKFSFRPKDLFKAVVNIVSG